MDFRIIDDLEMMRDSRHRAFGAFSDAEWAQARLRGEPVLRAGRQFGGFDGDRLVATARVYDMRQWWHGRPVSMGGIGGVTVTPEDRGRGVGRWIMTETLERCAGFGHALSVLYPATTPVYRALGWEHVGFQSWLTLRAEALRTLAAGPLPVRRAGSADARQVAAVVGRAHERRRDDGPVDWSAEGWEALLEAGGRYRYLAEDGFLSYGWSDGNTVLEVDRLAAASERTLRGLLALVGSGSSIAETVRLCATPDDAALWLLRDRPHAEEWRRHPWMLRVVDAPAAIAARGYPAAVSAEVPLEIEDAQLPGNSGSWLLAVDGGKGRLERADPRPGRVRLAARGLSALYGGVAIGTLVRSGLLAGGDPAAHDALGAAFAGRPFMLDYF